MATDPIVITDDYKWGLLVKSWATGDDYVGGDITKPYPHPRPDTKAEFDRQTALAGAGVILPPHIKSVYIIQATQEVLLIKLPPRQMIKDSEEQLGRNIPYDLPLFYDSAYNELNPTRPNITNKLRFHALRIGDYTIRLCT